MAFKWVWYLILATHTKYEHFRTLGTPSKRLFNDKMTSNGLKIGLHIFFWGWFGGHLRPFCYLKAHLKGFKGVQRGLKCSYFVWVAKIKYQTHLKAISGHFSTLLRPLWGRLWPLMTKVTCNCQILLFTYTYYSNEMSWLYMALPVPVPTALVFWG